jgi:hypothetical protein
MPYGKSYIPKKKKTTKKKATKKRHEVKTHLVKGKNGTSVRVKHPRGKGGSSKPQSKAQQKKDFERIAQMREFSSVIEEEMKDWSKKKLLGFKAYAKTLMKKHGNQSNIANRLNYYLKADIFNKK